MANATHNGHQTNGRVTFDEPENPLHRLSPEQIEEIGREFDELHQQVKDSLGDRDARYIRSIIALQRRLALLGRLELIASRWRIPWVVGASTLGMAKILENMEIGHNVLHGQWDWMNDPVINSRAWDWDTASPSDAWRHSHNYIHHTFTNIIGKDRDLGFEAIRKGEKDKDQLRKELKGIAGKARTQIQKDYIAWPLISGIVMTLVEAGILTWKARSQQSTGRRPVAKLQRAGRRLQRKRSRSRSDLVRQLAQ